jgi:single-strand DNA-binding protein
MASFNRVVLVGNLTRDIELKYTPNGSPVADMGLAINSAWTDKEGNKKEEVCFVDVAIWGSQAENCSKYLSKGKSALVEGRLKLDQWDDKETGQKRSKLKVTAERVVFLGSPDHADKNAESRPEPPPTTDQPMINRPPTPQKRSW